MAHHHIHLHSEGTGRNILSAFFINLAFTIISLIGGWLTNSMAIVSDSIHDLGCTVSIALAWVFERIAGHKPTSRFTFGYRRFTLLGAFINAFILLGGSSIVLYESIGRLIHPEEVDAEGMLWFALLAILFKGLAVWRTWKGASVNQRMVSLHLLGDCLGWVAVLLGSIVMLFVEIPLLDPILSVCISLYILYNVVHNLIVAFRIVLEGVPADVNYKALKEEVTSLPGIAEVSELRVWSLDNEHHAAEAKLTTTLITLEEVETLKSSLRQLFTKYGIEQSVIEIDRDTKHRNPLVLLLLGVAIFTNSQSIKAQNDSLPLCEYTTQLQDINLPLIEIWTVDGIEPTATVVQAPEGMWGTTLKGNEYVYGRLRMSVKGEVIYDSGDNGMKIRLRGNSSGAEEKKPYKVKLTQKEDLLFRGDSNYKDKDWVLQRLYNRLPLKIFMGLKVGMLVGLEWEPQWEYVNVVINGKYKGDYLLIEPVEREKHKVNIDKSGYLIEDDAYWWNEDVYFKSDMLYPQVGYTFKYPDTEALNDSIINNIRDFIFEYEHVLDNQGDITQYIDISNWAAWLLAQDILSQNDSGGTNRYIYKKDFDPQYPYRTQLKMGPLWDFDASLGATDSWAAIHNRSYSFYYSRLLQREDFYTHYEALWKKVQETLYEDIMTYLNDINVDKGEDINKSRAMNNLLYPDDKATPLQDEIIYAKEWLKERIEWLDKQLLTPNGIDRETLIESPSVIYDIYGRQLYKCDNLGKGVYIIDGKKVYIR